MTGSCPVSAHVCRETARERDELRAEVERLKSDVNRYRGSAALYQRLMQEAVSERDEARAEVERLRAAIKREANRHPSFLCDCQSCRIAREGR